MLEITCMAVNYNQGHKCQSRYFQYCWLYLKFPYNKLHFYIKKPCLLILLCFNSIIIKLQVTYLYSFMKTFLILNTFMVILINDVMRMLCLLRVDDAVQ